MGYEIDNWIITLNPWIRSADSDDENPYITKYIGNGEINWEKIWHSCHDFISGKELFLGDRDVIEESSGVA